MKRGDPYSYFELMDRCHITMQNMDDSIVCHPAIDAKRQRKLEKAQALIMDVYQWAGAKLVETKK